MTPECCFPLNRNCGFHSPDRRCNQPRIIHKPDNLSFYVWLNTFQGAIEIENKNFYEMKCFKNNQDSIKAVFELPELKKDTFGADFTEILKNKQTFKEGYGDMTKPIMVRQRLKNLEKKMFGILEESGLC